MIIVPTTLKEANAFVREHHRHHLPTRGHKFSIGVERDGELVGVAIVGRPVARLNDDGWTAEVLRVCVLDDIPNACSMLYGACWRAARGMGYRRMLTYTLPSESGISPRAAGFVCEGPTDSKTWSRPSRERVDKFPTTTKLRWAIYTSSYA